MPETISKEVLIVGGGPAGLKCAEEAQKHNIDYLVFEQGEVGHAWKTLRPDMPLLSPCHPQRDWTSLSSKFPIWKLSVKRPYCTSKEFCDYLDKFNEHFSFNIKTNTKVSEISYNGDEFILSDQHKNVYQAPILVMASGIFGNPFIPPINGINDNPNVMHSHYYQSANDFIGQSILVVGAGNSAAEIAIDLTSTAMVYLVSRKDLQYFADTQKLYHIRGISESYLKELIKMDIIRYRAYQEIQKIEDNRIYFKDWKLDVNKIIFATGYNGHISMLKNFKLRVNKSNYPEVSMSGESIQYPNLFFAGPLSYQNTSSIVLHGFVRQIPETFKRIADKLKSEGKNYLQS
ncbi:MAG: NAD(P)-binding domain-containing protein [Calditrichaceae bacterium]|nr:NAD(P)-binding domain-containing protein [Calditrichaceae bacterium]